MLETNLWESKVDTSGISFVRFWDLVSAMGLIKQNTARALSVATRKVLGVEESWENLDITIMDLDAIIETFKRSSADVYNSETINAYINNFRRALNVYLEYLDDPAGWRKFAASESGKRLDLEVKSDWRRGEWVNANHVEEAVEEELDADVRTYPFRLRAQCIIELQLPVDLSRKDVKRLKKFLEALMLDQ
jgi:hypothetical protein